MPEIYIHAVEGRSLDQKRALVRDITAAVVRNFNVTADSVMVQIIESSKENKAKGGFCSANDKAAGGNNRVAVDLSTSRRARGRHPRIAVLGRTTAWMRVCTRHDAIERGCHTRSGYRTRRANRGITVSVAHRRLDSVTAGAVPP